MQPEQPGSNVTSPNPAPQPAAGPGLTPPPAAGPTPPVSPGPGNGPRRTMVTVLLVVVVVLALLGLAAAMLMGSDSKKDATSSGQQAGANNDGAAGTEETAVTDRTDGKLDLSTRIDKPANPAAQDVSAKLNQQVNLGDGFSYMVTSVQRNWPSADPSTQPASGNEFVRLNVVIGNRYKTGNFSFSSSNTFKVQDASGNLTASTFVDTPEESLTGQALAPGQQVSGFMIFEVPKDSAVPYLVTSKQYTHTTSGEKITVASKVALQ